jgi:hypothetical protein
LKGFVGVRILGIGFTANGWFGGDKDKLPVTGASNLIFYANPEFDIGFATEGFYIWLAAKRCYTTALSKATTF